jgi:hypothetical protein
MTTTFPSKLALFSDPFIGAMFDAQVAFQSSMKECNVEGKRIIVAFAARAPGVCA